MAVCAVLLLCGLAQAQTYPAKPIRLVVGFPPGGSNDIVARLIAPKLTQLLGAQIDRREPARRERDDRQPTSLRRRRPTATRSRSAARARSRSARSRIANIPYDTLRDFAADHDRREHAGDARHPSVAAGAQSERARRAGEVAAGQARLRFFGQRRPAAPRDRALQEDRRKRTSFTCLTRAPRPR